MFRLDAHKGYFPVEEEEEREEEEAQLTLLELQRVVMELSKKVARLERHHAEF